MSSGIIDLKPMQLATAYIFVVILLVIVRKRGLSREKDILIASVRMTVQLIIAGLILGYIFDNPNPIVTLVVITLMEVFAIRNIFKRTKYPLSSQLKKIIAISMGTGTLLSLIYFQFVVVRISPWYDPRYFIPIGGMLIGNSMTGIALGVNQLIDGLHTNRDQIEASLMLGATPTQASKVIVDKSFDAAILPTINSMLGMGIVFLPGMMTGQILAGALPMTAIKYQIAIMLGILGSVTLSVIFFVTIGYKTFFNKDSQLTFFEEE